jgi:hypothetical protein
MAFAHAQYHLSCICWKDMLWVSGWPNNRNCSYWYSEPFIIMIMVLS